MIRLGIEMGGRVGHPAGKRPSSRITLAANAHLATLAKATQQGRF
jgi:hypothetical protein